MLKGLRFKELAEVMRRHSKAVIVKVIHYRHQPDAARAMLDLYRLQWVQASGLQATENAVIICSQMFNENVTTNRKKSLVSFGDWFDSMLVGIPCMVHVGQERVCSTFVLDAPKPALARAAPLRSFSQLGINFRGVVKELKPCSFSLCK